MAMKKTVLLAALLLISITGISTTQAADAVPEQGATAAAQPVAIDQIGVTSGH